MITMAITQAKTGRSMKIREIICGERRRLRPSRRRAGGDRPTV
jgi:hypothetical protein